MAIATLVLWVLTAAAGLVLLTAGGAAKRAAAAQEAAAQEAAAQEAAAQEAAAREAVPVPAPPVTVPGADPAPRAAGFPQAGSGSPSLRRFSPAPGRSCRAPAHPPGQGPRHAG